MHTQPRLVSRRAQRQPRRAGAALLALAGLLLLAPAGATAQSATPREERAEPEQDHGDASSDSEETTLAAPLAGDEIVPGQGDDDATDAARDGDAPWNRGVDIDKQRAGRAAFLQGNKLARRRFFASATAKYRQALALWPHPAFAYNLALAQLHLDQPIDAYASFERAVKYGPEPLGDRYEHAEQQLARLESELSVLEVHCAEPGARVMLDGKLLFTAPGEQRSLVRPGAHQVIAMHRTLSPRMETVLLAPGEREDLGLSFEYPEVEVAVHTRRWAAWKSHAVVASGAALLLGGLTLDWHSSRLFDAHDRDFAAQCELGCKDPEVLAKFESRQQRADREQRLAVIGYAAGGAVLVTGAVLTYLGREQVRYERRRVAPQTDSGAKRDALTVSRAAPSRVQLAPIVGPGIIGLHTQVVFW